MLEKLRAATQELHEKIEGENTADLIMKHNISVEQYKKLLLQNYVAYKITEDKIEAQLPEYTSDKTENLAKDLAELNVDLSISENFQHDFTINTDAEAPFVKAADYAVIGDAFEVVPQLIEKLKAFKIQNG